MPTIATTGRVDASDGSAEGVPAVCALVRDGTTVLIRRPAAAETPA